MKIEKKCWPEYYKAISEENKPYDVRLADFECNEGDTILFREWDPKTQEYTGRETEKRVTYVVKTKDLTDWGEEIWNKETVEKFGFQVFGIE